MPYLKRYQGRCCRPPSMQKQRLFGGCESAAFRGLFRNGLVGQGRTQRQLQEPEGKDSARRGSQSCLKQHCRMSLNTSRFHSALRISRFHLLMFHYFFLYLLLKKGNFQAS